MTAGAGGDDSGEQHEQAILFLGEDHAILCLNGHSYGGTRMHHVGE